LCSLENIDKHEVISNVNINLLTIYSILNKYMLGKTIMSIKYFPYLRLTGLI